jgi:hypothetical protein
MRTEPSLRELVLALIPLGYGARVSAAQVLAQLDLVADRRLRWRICQMLKRAVQRGEIASVKDRCGGGLQWTFYRPEAGLVPESDRPKLSEVVRVRPSHIPRVEMVVSDWEIDALGNLSRTIVGVERERQHG